MNLSDILSHSSQIRSLLDAIEGVCAAVIPGAAPVVAVADVVENAVFGAADALTGNSQAAVAAVVRSAPDANGVRVASVEGTWVVTDLTPAADVLHTGSYVDCETWAEANCKAGFSVRPSN